MNVICTLLASFSCFLVINAYYLPNTGSLSRWCSVITSREKNSFVLFTSKHYGRFGTFPDTFKPKTESGYKKLVQTFDVTKFTAEGSEFGIVKGSDKRRDRERDLTVAHKNLPTEDYRIPLKQRKWDSENIDRIIDCLNLSYGEITSRDQLTSAQRVGMIDWEAFNQHASSLIPDFESNEQTKKKVISWVKFHREKREIELVDYSWQWIPRNKRN